MAAPSVVFRGGAGSITVSFTGHAIGDILLAVVSIDRTFTVTVNNNFTILDQLDSGSGTTAIRSALIAKIATSASESVTVSGGTRSRSNASFVIRDHGLAGVDGILFASATGATSTVNYPNLTGLDANVSYRVLGFISGDGAKYPAAAPAGFGDKQSYQTGTGSTDTATTRFDGVVTGVTSIDPASQVATAGQYVTWVVAIPGGPWEERVVIAAPRNGTSAHTVDPSSTTGQVGGDPFTPTAGRLLVAVVNASVTCYGPSPGTAPSGWTLPTGGAAVNNSGLYVFWKIAAGGDTLVMNHNGSDYPAGVTIFEFDSAYEFKAAVAATSVGKTAANPDLTGLSGTNEVFGAKGFCMEASSVNAAYAWSGTGPPIEVVDTYVAPGGSTDGYALGVAFVQGYTGSSWQPTASLSGTNGSVPNTEAITFAVGLVASGTTYDKTQDDALGLTDNLGAVQSLGRSQADTLGLSDALGVTASYVRAQADALGLTDSLSSTLSVARPLADTLGLADSLASVASMVRSQADALGLTDSLTVAQSFDRSVADTLGMTDSLTVELIGTLYTKSQSDPLGLTDSLTVAQAFARSQADPLGLTDSLSATQSFSRAPADPLGLTDTLSTVMSAAREQADALGLADSLSVAFTYARAQADGLGLSDAVTAALTMPRTAADTLGLADALTVTQSFPRALADALGLSDTLTATTSRARTQSDALGLSDALTVLQSTERAAADTLGLTDSLTVDFFGNDTASIDDELDLTDTLTTEVTAVRWADDALGLSDAVAIGQGRALADTLGLSDAVATILSANRSTADVLGLSDALSVVKTASRSAADALGLTDALSAALTLPRVADDALGLSDGLDRTVTAVRNLPELTVRTNLAVNPQGSSTTATGWAIENRWFGSGGTGAYAVLNGQSDGPLPELTTYRRKTWATVGANTDDTAWQIMRGNRVPVVPGQQITVSMWWRPSWSIAVPTRNRMRLDFYDVISGGTTLGFSESTDFPAPVAGAWQRVSHTFTVPPGVTFLSGYHMMYTGPTYKASPGDTLDGTGLLVEYGTLGDYFDGGTPDTAQFDNAWLGTPFQSASTRTDLLSDTDWLGLDDDLTVEVGFDRTQADALGLSDALSRQVSAARSAADTLGMSDSLTVQKIQGRNPADVLGMSDDLQVDFIANGAALIDDPLGLTDTLTITRSNARTPADTLGLSDSLSITRTYGRTQADTLGLDDDLTTTANRPREISDALGMSDSLTVELIRAEVLDDDLTLTDTLTSTFTLGRTEDDVLTLTDEVSVTALRPRTEEDALGLTDTLTVTFIRAADAEDTLGLTDSLTAELILPFCWPIDIVLVAGGRTITLIPDSPGTVLVPDGPDVLLVGDGPDVTLAASGRDVVLAASGPDVVLEADGPDLVLVPEDAC